MNVRNAATGKNYGDEPDALNEHWNDPGDPDGVIAAERKRIWHDGHSYDDPRQVHAEQRQRYWPLITLVLVVVGMTVGAYFLGWHSASGPAIQKAQVAKNKSERRQEPVTTTTKHYNSTLYSLGFDYPNNWVVSDTKDKLTVMSPSFTMDSQNGSTTDNGHVVVTVQNQQSTIPGYPGNGATASLASSEITYKQPSNVQREQSSLAYLGYSSGNSIDAMYLTGDSTYQSGDSVPMEGVTKGNPLIGVTFVKCTKSYCMGGTKIPLSLKANSWDIAAFKTPTINLLQSLVLN